MELTESLIEFDKIKEIWGGFALTKSAKMKISGMKPFLSESELLVRLKETTESRLLLEKEGNPPLISLNDVREFLVTAEKEGILSTEQLTAISSSLVAVKRLKDYLQRCKRYEVSLAYYDENLEDLKEIRTEIEGKIRNGRVDDFASRKLKSLRSEIERIENKMREKASAVIRTNKKYLSDGFSTVKNGHICIPVKKEYKQKVDGTVVEQSSTGSTLFVEPYSVGKYYDELQSLQMEEENEVRRILYELTDRVAQKSHVFESNMKMMEKLDFIFSKGRMSLEMNGIEPEMNTERYMFLADARHPLMKKEVCKPIQFQIGNGIRGVVITGPNTGGKTVTLKTIALNCMMAQCGLHVACCEAKICMNSNFLCDIGDGQNLSENLSTFSAHIKNVLSILENVNQESLVIMDELGSGTDPTEGMGIAVAILEELKKSGALFLVTTHYPEVKDYAEREENIVNARMTFDQHTLKPLYQLIIGESGQSCAFYIARQLGMSEQMLERAALEAYGENSRGSVANTVFREGRQIKTELQETQQPARSVTGHGASGTKVRKKKPVSSNQKKANRFRLGDSVEVYPEKRIGIVCQMADEKGMLRVQLPDKKIWINHKRLKLLVAAEELYPENYDFSIIFDTAKNRKLRHQMEKHNIEEVIEGEE